MFLASIIVSGYDLNKFKLRSYFLITNSEVKAGNIHTGINHFDHHIGLFRCLSKSANDLSTTVVDVYALKDAVKLGAGRLCVLASRIHLSLTD